MQRIQSFRILLLIQLRLIVVQFSEVGIIEQRLLLCRTLRLLRFAAFLYVRWRVSHLSALQSQLYYLSYGGSFEEILKRVFHHLADEFISTHIEFLLLFPNFLDKSKIYFKEHIGAHSNSFL